jgi:citrate lyase subunit beta/citryl-CoA lyase
MFVPGAKARLLEKARTAAADAVILDLEDGVAPEAKAEARGLIRQALDAGPFGPQVVVRINGWTGGLAQDDLAATLPGGGVDAVCLPKAENPDEVQALARWLDGWEAQQGLAAGSLGVLLMIETALGVLRALELARSSPRVQALCLGGEDLSRDLGAVRTREGQELAYARAHVVVAARAAGVWAIDTVYTDLQDEDGLRAEASQARRLGYSGQLLIHPNQIEPVHQAWAPSAAEIEWARRVLASFDEATARGDGVVALDGKMIDAPVVARARELLAAIED